MVENGTIVQYMYDGSDVRLTFTTIALDLNRSFIFSRVLHNPDT